jgi:predicted metal-binding membrane protein
MRSGRAPARLPAAGARLTGSLAVAALTDVRWRAPAVVVQGVVLVAWIGYAAMLAAAGAPPGRAAPSAWWCMPGMTLGAGTSGGNPLDAALAGAAMWSVMVLAMTLPGAIPAVQHVAVNSLRPRQRRAAVEFLAVYLGLWLVFGLLAITGLALLPSISTEWLLALALLVATAWELTPLKRRALNRCHRSFPLPPRGVRASAAVMRFGWMNGSACIAMCWPTMLAMLLAPTARLGWAAGLTGLAIHSKLTRRPRRAARWAAALLGAAAIGVLLGLVLG